MSSRTWSQGTAHDHELRVCTQLGAVTQLAAALWQRLTGIAADSAGTAPAHRVHPGAVAAGRRIGLDRSR